MKLQRRENEKENNKTINIHKPKETYKDN